MRRGAACVFLLALTRILKYSNTIEHLWVLQSVLTLYQPRTVATVASTGDRRNLAHKATHPTEAFHTGRTNLAPRELPQV